MLTFPPEWSRHAATWLAWPHNTETWPSRLAPVQQTTIEIIKALHVHEPVNLLVNDAATEQLLLARFQKADIDLKKVQFHRIPTNDCWLRDTGPTFVTSPPSPLLIKERGAKGGVRSDTATICWQFNSWGEKWPPWDLDAKVSRQVAEAAGVPSLNPGIVLEGGSIETNGEGLLLTTESCLLESKRNPHLSKGDIEKTLKQFLGVAEVVWLKGEVPKGDDTDGHIDNLARFVSAGRVVTPLPPSSPDFKTLAGRFEMIQLPIPSVKGPDGAVLPASYANFYIANGVVLLPVFGVAEDAEAIRRLVPLFPKRRVVPINCRDLVLGFGGIHCMTQQQPQNCPSER